MNRTLRVPNPPDESGGVTIAATRPAGRNFLRRCRPLRAAAWTAILFPLATARLAAQAADYNVVVYGGSSAGVIAATQVARMGKSTLLILTTKHFGGMTASGLGTTDVGVAETIGGLAQEFYSSVHRYYDPVSAVSVSGTASPQFEFEPHVAEAVFIAMLHDSGATWIVGEQLDRQAGVGHDGTRISQLRMVSGRTFSARMFIDATYEGDLLAAAGVHYRIGREGKTEFGEALGGVQRNPELAGEVDPYRVPQQPWSGLLPGVSATPMGADGTGDDRVQQYNLRLCMTEVPANQIAITPPASYDASNYQLLARLLQQHPDWQLTDVCKIQPLPGEKADINATGSFSTDMAGNESSHWAEADDTGRASIQSVYRDYTQGLFWFLANDPAVSPTIRAQAAQWGLAKDEFGDTGHWPWQLYVREARRMVSSYVITQHDCEGATTIPDPVALGSYGLDSHKVTLFTDANGVLNTEGYFFKPVDPYRISYHAIVPPRADCTNLLVPVCVSATHVAFNSLRMEPVFMMLGQAAGTAACLAIDQSSTVQEVDYASLARRLQSDGQILTWPIGQPVSNAPLLPPPDGKHGFASEL